MTSDDEQQDQFDDTDEARDGGNRISVRPSREKRNNLSDYRQVESPL